jgi:membrane fusion protein (multidrug efflux system)
MRDVKIDWQKATELTWRILVVIVAVGILVIVTTRWNRWQGGAGWQITDDAYLQTDLTPIAAKVAGYVGDVPVQDYQHVQRGQLLAQRELQLSNIQAAKAVVTATQALLDQNARDLERQHRLLVTGSSSTEALGGGWRSAPVAGGASVAH